MNDVLFLGHYDQPNKNDKIWGVISSGDGALTFCGRRSGTISFKQFGSVQEAMFQCLVNARYARLNPHCKIIIDYCDVGFSQEVFSSLHNWIVESNLINRVLYISISSNIKQQYHNWCKKNKQIPNMQPDKNIQSNWNDLLPEDFDGQVLLARLGQVKFA